MTNQEAGPTIAVLLVGDQRFAGAAIDQLLANEPDIVLHFCQQATQAVARANEIRPAVILQDLVLPDIDGTTMVALFRANPPTADTPVIVLATTDDATMREKAATAGARDFLVKVPGREALVACIRRHAAGPPSTSVAPAPTVEETLSLDVLDDLRQSGDDSFPDFVTMLIDQFLEEATAQVEALTQASLAGDLETLKATLHSLKGSAMTMGAKRLASLCALFERHVIAAQDMAAPLPRASSDAMMADVGLEFVTLCTALAAERHKPTPEFLTDSPAAC